MLKCLFLLLLILPIYIWSVDFLKASTIYELTDKGFGEEVGAIIVSKYREGIKIFVTATVSTKSKKLGFHIHEKNSPMPILVNGKLILGGALGGHWDPDNTQFHGGPYNHHKGHRGDLPNLIVNKQNKSIKQTIIVEDITLTDLSGKSMVITSSNDNYHHKSRDVSTGTRLYAAIF
ncbi:MAG: superoxide dismutase family protein [Brevinema sp.]